MTALSSAELSSFITETGASYAFTKKAFGRFPSFLVGWFKYFDYIAGAAAVSVGFAAYFTSLFGLSGELPLLLAAMGLPVVFTCLSLFGTKESADATSIMVVIKVFCLGAFNGSRNFFILPNILIWLIFLHFFPNGINGTFSGCSDNFSLRFLGFNTVAMMSEETKEPEKNNTKSTNLGVYCNIHFVCLHSIF